jgi:H+/Cl- antiporter ClcA
LGHSGGIIGYFVPRVRGIAYDTIGDILNARLALELLLLVMLAKAVALVIALASGTSGGLLAPMFMSSAALGGAYALLMNRAFPAAGLAPRAAHSYGWARFSEPPRGRPSHSLFSPSKSHATTTPFCP